MLYKQCKCCTLGHSHSRPIQLQQWKSREPPSCSPTSMAHQSPPSGSARMHNKVKSHAHGEHKGSGRGGLSKMLRQHKARLYIIRRCVVMLLCCHD
uniref:Uncharacterized protein n=1 Tax=Avena sativa TaxID=4498 RepID=A0ACD5T7S2_AVESA